MSDSPIFLKRYKVVSGSTGGFSVHRTGAGFPGRFCVYRDLGGVRDIVAYQNGELIMFGKHVEAEHVCSVLNSGGIFTMLPTIIVPDKTAWTIERFGIGWVPTRIGENGERIRYRSAELTIGEDGEVKHVPGGLLFVFLQHGDAKDCALRLNDAEKAVSEGRATRAELRASGLAKLSPEEIEALDLDDATADG